MVLKKKGGAKKKVVKKKKAKASKKKKAHKKKVHKKKKGKGKMNSSVKKLLKNLKKGKHHKKGKARKHKKGKGRRHKKSKALKKIKLKGLGLRGKKHHHKKHHKKHHKRHHLRRHHKRHHKKGSKKFRFKVNPKLRTSISLKRKYKKGQLGGKGGRVFKRQTQFTSIVGKLSKFNSAYALLQKKKRAAQKALADIVKKRHAVKKLGQKAYKLVLKSKAQLEHSLKSHMHKKIKLARGKAKAYILRLKRRARRARSYVNKSRKARSALRTNMVNGKYSQRNKFTKYKHVFNKYKKQQGGVVQRWKRGVNRYMKNLFSQLKGICH